MLTILKGAGIIFFRWKPFRIVIIILAGFTAFQYFQTKIYEFPKPAPFSGSFLYNPYQNLSGNWLKANFHAHSDSWFGVTDGEQSGEEMISTYQKYGYDVACLSEYHKINPAIYAAGNISIPVYEHGMNISKVHHLGIGAEKVTVNDILLWQNNSIKQFLLAQMKESSPLVCINHPGLRGGHDKNTISQLTGYECLEVLNNHRKYFAHWDAVLSAGRPVWILGNDDCHDLSKEKFAFSWNLVHVTDPIANAVFSSLRTGRSIAVRRNTRLTDPDSLLTWAKTNRGDIIKDIQTISNTVIYRFKVKAKHVKLIGQDGHMTCEVFNSDSLSYTFTAEDTYIRAEIETEPFNVYLNPVVRFNGNEIPSNTALAKVQFFPTLIMRLSIIILYCILVGLLFPGFIFWLLYGSKEVTYTLYEQTNP